MSFSSSSCWKAWCPKQSCSLISLSLPSVHFIINSLTEVRSRPPLFFYIPSPVFWVRAISSWVSIHSITPLNYSWHKLMGVGLCSCCNPGVTSDANTIEFWFWTSWWMIVCMFMQLWFSLCKVGLVLISFELLPRWIFPRRRDLGDLNIEHQSI